MGCVSLLCLKQPYNYAKQQKLLNKVMQQFSDLNKCYSHDFVIKCHKNMLLNPEAFLLKYQKKIQPKQIVPYVILEKWKLILYGTNIDNEHYADCIGFDKQVEEERIAQKTYRFSKQNPFEIRLQDLYFHESYKQIQKDAGRVYLVPQIKEDLFEKVLKKIANHFPQSGYSLGINYIIGYFLLVGMSQIDSFWMFIHLALNEKFLALGFFQNDLPLTKVIIEIFKNILRRKNKQLYSYIYRNLEVDDSSWILKWITSFYLSTFPIQLCHYIIDYVLMFGILGLSVVGFTIVNFFQSYIFKCEQATDFIVQLQQLLSFNNLSKNLSIQKFMGSLYEVTLDERDFLFLNQIGQNFYVDYFSLYSDWYFKGNLESREKMQSHLSKWYVLNKDKREQFTKMAKTLNETFFHQPRPKINQHQHLKKEMEEQNYLRNNRDSEQSNQQTLHHRSQQRILITFEIPEKVEKTQQKPQIIKCNTYTIKISSKHKNLSEESSSSLDQDSGSNSMAFSNLNKKFKKPMSQLVYCRHSTNQSIRMKSDGYLHSNKLKQKRKFKKTINPFIASFDRKESFSPKSFSRIDSLSQGFVTFNWKPQSQDLSDQGWLSNTLPARKFSDQAVNKSRYYYEDQLKEMDLGQTQSIKQRQEPQLTHQQLQSEDKVSDIVREDQQNFQHSLKEKQIEKVQMKNFNISVEYIGSGFDVTTEHGRLDKKEQEVPLVKKWKQNNRRSHSLSLDNIENKNQRLQIEEKLKIHSLPDLFNAQRSSVFL